MKPVIFLKASAPTPAQLEAGNYRKGHRWFRNMRLTIENPKGSFRRWKDADGSEGRTEMKFDYGYIRGTLSAGDDEHVDCYIGPNEDAANVYVIDQAKVGHWDEFDEQKVMLGFDSEDEAKAAYLEHYTDPRFFMSIRPMPLEEFREKAHATLKEPAMIKSAIGNNGDFSKDSPVITKSMPVLFLKTHIEAYTKKDGTFVQAHEDKRHPFPSRDDWNKMHPIVRKDNKWHLVGKDGETISSHMMDDSLHAQRNAEYFRQKKLHAEGSAETGKEQPKAAEKKPVRKKSVDGKFVHDPVSGFDWPASGEEPKILFHNSQSDKNGFEVKDSGTYGGIFVGPNAGMDLGYKHAVVLDPEAHAEHRDLKNFTEQKLDSAVKKTLPSLSKKQRTEALDYLFEEKSGLGDEDSGKLKELFGTSDPDYIYNVLQARRGEFAVALGFKSVDMKDETGVSTWVAPGAKTYALEDGESFDQAEARIYEAWKDWKKNRYNGGSPQMAKSVDAADLKSDPACRSASSSLALGTILFLKAKVRGDDRTADMFATHVEARTRKDGHVQNYHVANAKKDAALDAAISHLKEDAKQADMPAHERKEDKALVAKLEEARGITVTSKKKVRDPLEGTQTHVTLSNGKTHRLQRLNATESMGLPGWHDVDGGFLADNEQGAIDELVRRAGKSAPDARLDMVRYLGGDRDKDIRDLARFIDEYGQSDSDAPEYRQVRNAAAAINHLFSTGRLSGTPALEAMRKFQGDNARKLLADVARVGADGSVQEMIDAFYAATRPAPMIKSIRRMQ